MIQVWEADYDRVLYVMQNLREADAREIYALDFVEDPIIQALSIVASGINWVIGKDDEPICVIGASPEHPGVWQVYMVGTARFDEIAIFVTRFAKKVILPALIEAGAHRLSTCCPASYTKAQRWLEILGGHRECVIKQYGKDRQDYHQYAFFPEDIDGRQEG